jgi:hypothetical protein
MMVYFSSICEEIAKIHLVGNVPSSSLLLIIQSDCPRQGVHQLIAAIIIVVQRRYHLDSTPHIRLYDELDHILRMRFS